MNRYYDRESGSVDVRDRWAAYRGKYPDPTPMEGLLISLFLDKFRLECHDFVEDEDEAWLSFKKRLQGSCANPRDLLVKFLTEVRQSKGYDVDSYIDFSGTYWETLTSFVPRSLDEATVASKFAIREINTHMMARGKSYELVSAEKLVSATNKYDNINVLLLTFTAKEIATAHLQTFQAMLNTTSPFKLKEWKFAKSLPIQV